MKKILLSIIFFIWFYQISFADSNIYYISWSNLYSQNINYIDPPILYDTDVFEYWINWIGDLYYFKASDSSNLYKIPSWSNTWSVFYTLSNMFYPLSDKTQITFSGSTHIFFLYYSWYKWILKLNLENLTIENIWNTGNEEANWYSPFYRAWKIYFWTYDYGTSYWLSTYDFATTTKITDICTDLYYAFQAGYAKYVTSDSQYIYLNWLKINLSDCSYTDLNINPFDNFMSPINENIILFSSGSRWYAKDTITNVVTDLLIDWTNFQISPTFFSPIPPSWNNTQTNISIAWLTCKSINYPVFTSSPYTIGNWTFSDNSSGSLIPEKYTFQWLANSNSYQDRFSVYPSTGIYLDTETFTGWIEAGKITTIYSDLDLISQNLPTSLSVNITRTWAQSIINYVKIKTNNQGFSPINSNQKNIVAEVRFNGIDWKIYTYPMVYSGWYAIALSRFPAKNINIRFTTWTVTFDWFEVWYTNDWSINKTSCANSAFICEYTQQSPGIFSCDSALNVSWIPQWECEISNNICQPKTWIIPYYDWAIVPGGAVQQAINASGAVVWLDYEAEDIFTCDESGLSVLICPFKVIGKVWSKFTFVIKKLVNLIYGISSLGSPSWQGKLLWFFINTVHAEQPDLIQPFDYSNSWTSAESYTWRDMINLNKSIFTASDNVYHMENIGIKWIYTIAQWFLILVFSVIWFVLFLIAFN